MKKILLFGPQPYGQGGMEKIIHTLTSSVPTIKSLYFNFHNGKNLKTGWLTRNEILYYPNKFFPRLIQELLLVRQLNHIVKQEKPDIIVCLDDKACLYANQVKKANSFKIVTWLHRSIHTFKHKEYFLLADAHIAISNSIAENLQIITKSDKIFLLKNCFDVPFVHLFNNEQKTNDRILYVGRIEYEGQKYLKDLIIALSKTKETIKLDVIGDGPEIEKHRLKTLISKLKLNNRVYFHGWQTKPWEYLKNANICSIRALCLTSTYEGFPLTIIEALSQGIFVLSSDCPTGPNEIITQQNGKLFKTHDTDTLAKLINDDNLNNYSHQKIIDSVRDLSKDNYIKKIDTIFNSI